MNKFVRAGAVAILSILVLFGTPALAENWPQRTVRIVVPLGPGSGADISARLLADRLGKFWSQPVIVENRPGGDGLVGITSFLAGDDDHKLLFTPTGTFTTYPLLHGELPFDQRDLVPISRVTNTLTAISVPASLKINSLGELVALIRSRPDNLDWASVTGATELVFTGFLKASRLGMTKVPYRDSVQALNDLTEGRIETFLSALITVQPQGEAGRIKILAVTNRERGLAAPAIPTAAEAGYPALTYDGLVGFFGTHAMPAELRERIASDVRQVVTDHGVANQLSAMSQIVSPSMPAEFAASIEEQRGKFSAIANETIGSKP